MVKIGVTPLRNWPTVIILRTFNMPQFLIDQADKNVVKIKKI